MVVNERGTANAERPRKKRGFSTGD